MVSRFWGTRVRGWRWGLAAVRRGRGGSHRRWKSRVWKAKASRTLLASVKLVMASLVEGVVLQAARDQL